MRSWARVAAIVVAGAFAATVFAQTGTVAVGSEPGKAGIAQTVKLTGTITAIDPATRDVTIKGSQGNEVVVTAGPEVKNFANMKVGDQVDAQYIEALTLELKKGGGMPVARTEQTGGVKAKEGEKPGAAVGRQVTVVADVIAVDPAKQTVTLKGPKQTVDLKVADPEQFKLIKVGDQVQATYTQALAIAVEAKK
jgi:hypothetical protein